MPPLADTDPGAETAQFARTVLLFRLDGETFALPVTAVNEIIDPQRTTPVPNASPLAPGIINVRGTIIPFLDIRVRLGMPPQDAGPATRMIVFEQPGPEGDLQRIAFAADAVERVVDRADGPLAAVPELGVRWPADCLAGCFRDQAELVICLDPTTVFDARLAMPGRGEQARIAS